jgi:mono/diheme cytochrome c family protein
MPERIIRFGISWLPHVSALLCAFVLVLIFRQDQAGWQDLKLYETAQLRLSDLAPSALVWRQPVLPAQYSEAACGTCHQDDLPETPRLNHGRQLIARYNCIGCHQLQNIERPPMLGPDLTRVGTKVSREWIYKWLKDPRTLTDADGTVTVNGVYNNPRMPRFQLSDQELRALSAYLSVQRAKPDGKSQTTRGSVVRVAKAADAVEQGQMRFNEMFCVTCHALAVNRGGETTLIGGNIGPELTKVGTKVRPEWLAAWLRNPQAYLQHTRMSQYQWSEKDLFQVAQFILNRLTDPDLLKDVPALGALTDTEVERGRVLFVKKGCAECHVIEGVIPQTDFGPNLSSEGMSAGPYSVEIKSASALKVSLHFAKNGSDRLQLAESIVPRSMIAFIQAKITNPASVDPEAHMPQFSMSQSDLDDVTTALLSMSGAPLTNNAGKQLTVPKRQVEFHPDGPVGQLVDRYKCTTCHAFNGYGGTLAPDLSFEGSRSRREWLSSFLKNPQTLRPTLTVRMPRFNMPEKDAATIADYLAESLQHPSVNPASASETEFTPQTAASGKELYEVKYSCQSCHTIGSSGGYVGPSLNNVGNWMTPAWIEAWLFNPQALIPGIIEPRHSFADGEIPDITAYLLTLKQASSSTAATDLPSGGQQ